MMQISGWISDFLHVLGLTPNVLFDELKESQTGQISSKFRLTKCNLN